MPLTPDAEECGADNCEIQTNYYKIVWIPYLEGMRINTHRGTRGKEAHLFLCPEHYPCPSDLNYTITQVSIKVKQDDF